jgi:hypothetical protein
MSVVLGLQHAEAQWSLYVPHSGHYMYRQFNIQQSHVLPTQLYLCVLCGSQNKQPLFPYTALTVGLYNREGVCLLCGTDWVFKYNSGRFSRVGRDMDQASHSGGPRSIPDQSM